MEKATSKKSPKKPSPIEHPEVPSAVLHRLPRYFRYLRELIRQGKARVSSTELSAMMNITASQIRQDLNCFGGFGQQGYGYNVTYLYAKICELLGVSEGLSAIIVGAGDLGRALSRSAMFEKRGVDVISMFDVNPALIGREIGGVRIRHIDELETFCRDNKVSIAVLTVPKENAEEVFALLEKVGVPGIWNFTGREINRTDTVIENVHLGDSLMILNYRICQKSEQNN